MARTLPEWRQIREEMEQSRGTIGFVPTMGALHEGHGSLIQRCVEENEKTVVSIFVNPAQFNDSSDLDRYPRDVDGDLAVLDTFGVHVVFLPDASVVYPDDYRYRVVEQPFSAQLCGANRPGHFDGVLTVVMRLLNLVRPNRSYFGEKDYQQLRLVTGMVEAFFLDVDIVPCPIIRDDDGVAVSSRNALLSPAGRAHAAEFARILREGSSPQDVVVALEDQSIAVDYVEELDGRRFGAVVIDGVRLIDNVPVA